MAVKFLFLSLRTCATEKKVQTFKNQNLHAPLLFQVTNAGGVASSRAFGFASISGENSRYPAVQGPFVVF